MYRDSDNKLQSAVEFGLRSGKPVIDKYPWETHQLVPLLLVLASDGIAAEHHGGKLGQYSVSGEHNNSPYYVQTDTLSHSDSRPVYLYRADNNQWWVSDVLGERAGWLKNPSDSVSVPETGWKVADGTGTWPDDPQLTARCGPLTECGDITVTSNGPTAVSQSDCLGVYKRTDIISSGHFVFKHQDRDRYLSIAPHPMSHLQQCGWGIRDKPGATRPYRSYVESAAGANCPASNRNRYSERFNWKSWLYFEHGEWHEDPTITVTCTNHNPDYY